MSAQTINQIISIGSDHGGFALKQALIDQLHSWGYPVINAGCDSLESVDYPDFAKKVCHDVLDQKASFGILICRSGNGMSMTANKFKHIRAALCHVPETAALARAHNDANVLVLGADYIDKQHIHNIVQTFITTSFEGGRHLRRVQLIDQID